MAYVPPNPNGQNTSANSAPVVIASDQSAVNIQNSPYSFKDEFTSFNTSTNWTLDNKASGDLIIADGNALGITYVVISLDPTTAGTTTSITTQQSWNQPTRVAALFSVSQRIAGSDLSMEWISTETPLATYTPVSISSIQQATTTLTITTATNHGLMPGDRFSVVGVTNDSRLNYGNLVVATITSATTFTATAGAAGTIPNVSTGPFSVGTIYNRPGIGYAPNGTSMVFENTTAGNASFFIKSSGTSALGSGTLTGNQSANVSSTASTVAASSYGTYCFYPSSSYELINQHDAVEWMDKGIDNASTTFTIRYHKDQCLPDPTKTYKLRFRAINEASLTVPVATIVSAVKSGTTTATITTTAAHGLTTGDYVNIYGISDTTNFPNLSTATVVASIIDTTHFTIIIGTASSTTAYGGYVSRVNGGVTQPGASTIVASSVSRTSNIVTLISASNWTGCVIGDYINLIGINNVTTGASIGVDGSYRVVNLATTTLTLQPIGAAPTGSDIGSTNCGGTFIKRTDLRLNMVRVQSFSRTVVESYGGMNRSSMSSSLPVYINNSNYGINVAQINGVAPTLNSGPITTGTTRVIEVQEVVLPTINAPLQQVYTQIACS